jgi:hypothetical protein
MKRFWFLGVVLGLLVATWIPAAQAIPFLIKDANSLARIDPATQDGMYDWVVDGVDQLETQWFWYRVGGTGPEASIHNLTLDAAGVTDTDFDGDFDNFFARYLGTGFNIEVNFKLVGGLPGSHASDIAETITVNNTGASVLDFHIYQYTDFDLGGTPGDDTVELISARTFGQIDSGLFASETVVTPAPQHYEAAIYSTTLGKLVDGIPTTLSDTVPSVGPANVTFAWQWDTQIAGGTTFQISKDKQVTPIPEPSTLLLLGFGLIGVAGFAWRRKRKQS